MNKYERHLSRFRATGAASFPPHQCSAAVLPASTELLGLCAYN